MEPNMQCTALNVSDEKQCEEIATSINGLFCSFHSHQCQGLYRGYKKRNERLDRLAANPPKYLADTKTPLVNQLFTDVDTLEVCQEVHDFLLLKYRLLDRVIRARKLHHSRFFSMNMDYGHEKYLASLQSQKAAASLALERLERRTAEILYKNQKWFKWVRQCQDDEEAKREKEQKKIKQEASMFKRHWKVTQERLNRLSAIEDRRKQDAFLEKTYKERMLEREEDDDESNSDWDPIDDVLEDNRGNFINLINQFLWMATEEGTQEKEVNTDSKRVFEEEVEGMTAATATLQVEESNIIGESGCDKRTAEPNRTKSTEVQQAMVEDDIGVPDPEDAVAEQGQASAPKPSHSKKTKPKGKKKGGKRAPASSKPKPQPDTTEIKGKKKAAATESAEPDKLAIETRAEMQHRLKEGADYNMDHIHGRLVGTLQDPVLMTKTIAFDDDEIEKLLKEVVEIKHLLFCRLLLGYATLLPAALRASSVEEFLADEEVTIIDLRDLCLRMENPSLQEIRDACADLFRAEDEEDNDQETQNFGENEEEKEEEDSEDELGKLRLLKPRRKKGALPETWKSKREKDAARQELKRPIDIALDQGEGGTAVDFGDIKDGKNQRRKIRVKVCGRSVWNYPSDKAMSRGGWLHFCIIAKESSLEEAVSLCRHWDEFYELNVLAIWHYFPGANWANWVGNQYRNQMLQLGFIMYMESVRPDAKELTSLSHSAQTRVRTTNGRKAHAVVEARNFICAHIKRDDQVSRRLIQYLSMHSHELLVLVRDAETGRLLITPPEDQRWLYRSKIGLGRAAKNDWKILKQIGPAFFDEMDKYRSWNFSFKEYYDIYIWDLEEGLSFPALYNSVQRLLFKALRCKEGADLYLRASAVLKTLYQDKTTFRTRDIVPGQDVESLYDSFTSPSTGIFFSKTELNGWKEVDGKITRTELQESITPRGLWYNEADALEDRVLFPEEITDEGVNSLAIGKVEPLKYWEEEGFSFKRFVEGQEFGSDTELDSEMNSDDEQRSEDDGDDADEDESQDSKHIYGDGDDISLDGQGDEDDNDEDDADEEMIHSIVEKLIDGDGMNYSEGHRELLKKLYRRRQAQPEEDTEVEFMLFLEKDKSKIFKEVWHAADTEPNAQPRWAEMCLATKYSRKYNLRSQDTPTSILSVQLFDWLDALGRHDSLAVHRAIAKLSPFFFPDFFESKPGQQYKDSLLYNQEERAKHLPDIRTHTSNTYRATKFWGEWDEARKNMAHGGDLDAIPEYMDTAIRPIVAHLYKAGVLRNRPDDHFQGQATAGKEPGRDKYDLFIDWRPLIETVQMGPHMVDPHKITPFKTAAQAFAYKHPHARFAVLKLWSAPHFYPLMIGPDNHDRTSFRDLYGRRWIWMFVPKDMPSSEWSIQLTANNRIRPYKRQLGDRVIAKRDAYLVMGEDEKELLKYASATAYAVQRQPWRWEIDLWKSWVNVDIEFLEKLDDRWLA